MWALWLASVLFISKLCSSEATCAMYGNCGKKSLFGASLPCPVDADFQPPSAKEADIELLKELCGDEWKDKDYFCLLYTSRCV